MGLLVRVAGAASRRLGRPELLGLVSAAAREEQVEQIGIGAVLASSLRGRGTYVDVGTNRGQLLGMAVRVAPEGRHYAFEPVPELAEAVRRTYPTVECRQKALGARPERARFCHFRGLDGWSGLRRNPEIDDRLGQPEYIDVEVSTLDAELEGVAPAAIKIDVEGAELGVLEGGRTLLSEARPLVVFEHVARTAQLYGARPEDVWDVLHGCAYEIFSLSGDGPLARSEFAAASRVVNWLAVPRGEPPAGAGPEAMHS